MKFPSLLNRLSHLIIVQVIFIFSAITLITFWSDDNMDISQDWAKRKNVILSVANDLADYIAGQSMADKQEIDLTKDINRFLSETNVVSHADLLCNNNESGQPVLKHLGSTINDKSFLDNHSYVGFYYQLLDLLNSTEESYISLISDNNESVNIIVKPASLKSDEILILGADYIIQNSVQNEKAEVILLLFLISTLISLLIVYLFSKGIREPLIKLKEGFNKVAAGEKCEIEITGDRYIRSVANDFNIMTQILFDKKSQVEQSNRKLKQKNKHVIESESILTSLIDYSTEGILATDLNDKITIFNQVAAKAFGFGSEDMTGLNIGELIPKSEIIECKKVTGSNQAQAKDIVCFQKNGDKFPAFLASTLLGIVNETPIAKLYFIKDISESANYQDMILKLDRSASRGRMARDIAHEINNYLAILQGNIELAPLFIAKQDFEKLEKKLGVMKDTVTKITNFTEGLTRFSNETPEYNKEDLNQLIENLIAFIKPQNKYDDVRIDTMLADDIPLVEIDNGQIQLLLVNLISNGAEAQEESKGDKWVAVETIYEASSNSVRIRVSDGGPGVDKDRLDDIFVMRFSTKREGTGRGLLTSKNIAENHKGSISYSKGTESDTIFELNIPSSRPVENIEEKTANSNKVNV